MARGYQEGGAVSPWPTRSDIEAGSPTPMAVQGASPPPAPAPAPPPETTPQPPSPAKATPLPSPSTGTVVPADIASKSTVVPSDLASSDPQATASDTLKEFPTAVDLDQAAGAGHISKQVNQDAKAELLKRFNEATPDVQKQMREAEENAAKAETAQQNKTQPKTVVPGDVSAPVGGPAGQTQQGQISPVLNWIGEKTGIGPLWDATQKDLATAFQALGWGVDFNDARDHLKQLNTPDANGNKVLSDADYATKLAKVNEAEQDYNKAGQVSILGGPKDGQDLSAKARQLMQDAVPEFMKYGQEKGGAEAKKGAVGIGKDIVSTTGSLLSTANPFSIFGDISNIAQKGFNVAAAEHENPTGEGVNFFDQTPGQRIASTDEAYKNYQDALDRITIPEWYYQGAPKSELEAAHMAAEPERAEAVRAVGDNVALALGTMGLAPITGPIEEAIAGGVTKGISTVLGKPTARFGETLLGKPPSTPWLQRAREYVGQTAKTTGYNLLFDPGYREAWGKAIQGDPSDLFEHHWYELAGDLTLPNILGVARKAVGRPTKYLGDVMTTIDAKATRDLVRGEAVPSSIPYRAAIKGNLYRAAVGLPASVAESTLTGAVRMALPSLIANNPQISQGDWNGFFHDVETGGLIHAALHAPYDLQRVIRNSTINPFYLMKGGTGKPAWGPEFYNDKLSTLRAQAYKSLNPDLQNQWLHLQGWAKSNGVEANLLPRDTVNDVAQNVYGATNGSFGFSVPDNWNGTGDPPKIFVSAEDFDPTGYHEIGHATLDGMHPEDQKRFLYAASQIRNLDEVVNGYAHKIDPTLSPKTKVNFADLPTANEADPTNPEYNQTKVDLGNRVGLPTQDHALKEVAADTMGQFMSGTPATKYTKNPSLLRQLGLGMSAGMERWGLPTTTVDMNGPIAVPKGMVMGKLFDKYMRKWQQGGYSIKGAPQGEIQLPARMEQGFQAAEAAKNAPLPPPATPPSHADIQTRAYQISQEHAAAGRAPDLTRDWLQAEFQLSHPEGRPPPQRPAPTIPERIGKLGQAAAPFYNKLPVVAALHPPRTLAAPPPAPGAQVAAQPAQPAQPRFPVPVPTPESETGAPQQPAPKPAPKISPGLSQHIQATLKQQGLTPGQAQAVVENRVTTGTPQKETAPGRVVGVVGSEFGEVDNPQRGGYSEPNWNKGAWGDRLDGEDNRGVALPQSILSHVGYHGQKGYGQEFNNKYAVRIHNPKTGATTTTSLKDLGPGASTGALIDMLWGTRKDLGFDTNFKGAVNFEIVDKKTGQVVYAPTGHEINEGGGGGGGLLAKGGGGGGGGGGYGTYSPEAQAQLQEYAQELASQPPAAPAGGTYKPAPEIQAPARHEGGGAGGYAPGPAVQEIDQTPMMMGMGYGPMALGMPPGAMGMPPAAPGGRAAIETPMLAFAGGGPGALSFMPGGRGPTRIGGLETEGGEGGPSTLGNGEAANALVAPHLAKGTLDSLKDAIKAHAGALSSDDPRVQKQPDGMFKGEYFQPGDNLHAHVLGNTPDNEQHVLRAATDAMANRNLMHVTYASAPRQGLGEEAPTTKTRQIEYQMSSPQARMLKQTTAQLAGHTMVPTSIGVKLAAKKGEPHEGYVQGLSMNALANNHHHINRGLAEAGEETPYPELNQKFINDMEGYVSNLNAGHKGTGEGHQAGSEEYPVYVDPTHVPYRINPREASFLNAVINNQAARAKSATGLRELARRGGTLLNEEGETNPIRHAIDQREAVKRRELAEAHPENPVLQERANKRWSQDTLEPVIRTFKAGLVHEVHPSAEEMPEAIRPGEAFKPLGEAMQRQMPYGRPDVPLSLAFMPMAGVKAKGYPKAAAEARTFITPLGQPRERFEISDRDVKFHAAPPNSAYRNYLEHHHYKSWGDPMRLSEAIDHPELFENYPQLHRTKIRLNPDLRYDGYYQHPYSDDAGNRRGDELVLKDPEDRDTLAHEIQHAVQYIERHPGGANPAEINKQLDAMPEVRDELIKQSKELFPKMSRKEFETVAEANWGKGQPEEALNTRYDDHIDTQDISRRDWIKQRQKQMAFALYQRAPGEMEARTAGFRARVPTEQESAQRHLQYQKEATERNYPYPEELTRAGYPQGSLSFMPASEREFKSATPEEFIAARNKSKRPQYLSPLAPEDITNHQLYMNPEGTAGAAVSPEGDIQNVFNNGGGKGAGQRALAHAIRNGGRTLDAYDPYLPALYRQFGFHETGRMKFNRDYAPPNWNFKEDDDPDIAFMAHKGYPPGGEEAALERATGPHENWLPNEHSTREETDWDQAKERSRSEVSSIAGEVPGPEALRAGEEPGYQAGRADGRPVAPALSFMAAARKGKTAAEPPPPREPSDETKAKLGPRPEDDEQGKLWDQVAARLDTQHRDAIPLEPDRKENGDFRYKKVKDKKIALYKEEDYALANSPMLQQMGKALGTVINPKTGKPAMAKAPEGTVDRMDELDPENRLKPYLNPTDRLRVSHLDSISATSAIADKLYDAFQKIKNLPEVMAAEKWYDEAEAFLDKHFGSHKNLVANLLGATSAGTNVKVNYGMAMDAYHQFLRGAFDRHIDLYRKADKIRRQGKGALMQHVIDQGIHTALGEDAPTKDTEAMDQYIRHHDITPRGAAGKLFGHNSLAALKVLAHTWEREAGGPKTPNFAANLSGRSLQATIDMWAARHVHRLTNDGYTDKPWRIQPAAEPGVNDVDFGLSQIAFRKAAERLGYSPKSLQAILWFAEQKHWQDKGWEQEIDPLERDYRPMLQAYQKPSDITPAMRKSAEKVRRKAEAQEAAV